MATSAIAASELRAIESRRALGGALHRLGASLARPSSLAAIGAAGALAGFALTRAGGAGAVAKAIARAALGHAAAFYVRQRTVARRSGGEDGK
jgi:hypothetical protein